MLVQRQRGWASIEPALVSCLAIMIHVIIVWAITSNRCGAGKVYEIGFDVSKTTTDALQLTKF